MKNIDKKVVEDFGNEWSHFTQSTLTADELKSAFDQYFHIFPFNSIDKNSIGFDMGCGNGRWAKIFSDRVKILNCIEPSEAAILVAKNNLSKKVNIKFICSSVDETNIPESSQDFGYCLGVLHHIPNTYDGIVNCSKLLKPGAPFLLYLYYNFENKPYWYSLLWKLSNIIRILTSRFPFPLKLLISYLFAFFIYFPFSRLALLSEKIGLNVSNIPLSDYRNKSFYFIKTDSLDRFGTRIEKRFSKREITEMLINAGFENIEFSDRVPHWVCLSYKK